MTIAAADPGLLVVDLSDVTFVDSTILGVLAGARSRFGRDSDGILLVINHPAVLRLFHVTGLDQVFAIHPARDDATPPA